MPVPHRQLIDYYRSRDFAKDYANFARRDPATAAAQLRLIVEQLNANLSHAGITPTISELATQERFASGHMPMADMITFIREYAASIEARWPS